MVKNGWAELHSFVTLRLKWNGLIEFIGAQPNNPASTKT